MEYARTLVPGRGIVERAASVGGGDLGYLASHSRVISLHEVRLSVRGGYLSFFFNPSTQVAA